MNFLKKGPELKLSELHVPDFAYDIYYDLKERHLLPLAALLVIALVAVPLYVKTSTGSDSESEVEVAPVATGSATSGGASLTVARSEPGLREPSRRLKHARALDPFATQGGSSSSAESAAAEGSSAGEASAPAPSVPTEATVLGGESGGSSETSGPVESYVPYTPPGGETGAGRAESGGGKTLTRYASEAIDVRIVSVPTAADKKSDKRTKSPTQVRRDLPELTMLPARSIPAVTFMGTTPDGKKALLVVSSNVESIFGEAKCLVGSQSCQLLALEKGFPETLVYGPQERTYRIELLKIRETLSAKPRRAKLTAPKRKRPEARRGGEAGDAATEAPAG